MPHTEPTARLVSPDEARRLEHWMRAATGPAGDEIMLRLAHTVAVQGEQIAAVLALLDQWTGSEERHGYISPQAALLMYQAIGLYRDGPTARSLGVTDA